MVDWLAVGWGGRVGKWPNGNLGNLQRQPTASGHSAVLALELRSCLTLACDYGMLHSATNVCVGDNGELLTKQYIARTTTKCEKHSRDRAEGHHRRYRDLLEA